MAQFLANLRAKALDETNSVPLNSASKEMDEARAYFTLVAKKMKKANKNIKGFVSDGSQVSIGFAQFAASVAANEGDGPVATSLEKASNWEYYMGDLMNTLIQSLDYKVGESFLEFTKNEIPAAEGVKKKYDQSRRDYDASITKVQALQKEKKPNPPKIQQAEQEREKMKQAYLQKGEEAFNALLDCNEMSSFTTLEKMCTYFEAYYQFFKGGFQWLRDFHDNVLPTYKKVVADEKSKFEQRRRKRPQGEWIPDSISGGASSRTRQFATPYDDIIKRDNPPNGIPVFLEKALDYLEAKALSVQGIFRVSPPKTQLDEIKKKIDAGKEVNWEELDDHLVTGTVKLFLRDLPQPLLTFDLYPEFVAVNDTPDEALQVKAIIKAVSKLPKGNTQLLKRLLRLCCKIEQRKDENKMTSSNLAVVLCPSILYTAEPNPLTMVEDIEKANKLMVLMIRKFSDIFGETLPAFTPGASAPAQPKPAGPTGPPPPGPPTSLPPPPSTNPGAPPATNPPPPSTTPAAAPSTNPPPPTSDPVEHKPTLEHKPSSAGLAKQPPPSNPPATAPATLPDAVTRTMSTPDAAPAKVPSSLAIVAATVAAPVTAPVAVAAPAASTAVNSAGEPYMSPAQHKQQLAGLGSQPSVFFQMQEIAGALCAFSVVAAKPSFVPEDVAELNNALKGLAKAIKGTLETVKDFSTRVPQELGKRLLLAAKGLQENIMGTANAYKAVAEGKPNSAQDLFTATRNYIAANYKLIMRVKEISLADELTSTSDTLASRVQAVTSAFETADRQAIAIATNALQGQSFKLAALMRAKALDTESNAVRESLTHAIEATEKTTQEATMEVRTMLFDPNQDPRLTDSLTAKLQAINDTAHKVEGLVEQLQSQNNTHILNSSLFGTTIEQLMANVTAHSANPSGTMKTIVGSLLEIANQIRVLQGATGAGDAVANKVDWMAAANKITTQVELIKALVAQTSQKASDAGTQANLSAYVMSAEFLNILMKATAPPTAFDVKLEAQENARFMTALKDFVFITFPFLFAFNEALASIEGS